MPGTPRASQQEGWRPTFSGRSLVATGLCAGALFVAGSLLGADSAEPRARWAPGLGAATVARRAWALTYATYRGVYALLFEIAWIPGPWVLGGLTAGVLFGALSSTLAVRRHLRSI